MLAAVVALLIIAVLFGVAFTFGGPVIALIVVVVGVVAAGIYVFAMGRTRTTPGDVVREADEQEELLGPGGQDDPTR